MQRFLTAILPVLVIFALVGCEGPGSGLRGPVEPDLRPSQPAASLRGSVNTVVTEDTAYTGGASAVIGTEGGRLAPGRHVLHVSGGAVAASTTFRIAKTHATDLWLKLTATRVATNDVGALGFAVPVRLVLSYGNVLNVVDPLLLQITAPAGADHLHRSAGRDGQRPANTILRLRAGDQLTFPPIHSFAGETSMAARTDRGGQRGTAPGA